MLKKRIVDADSADAIVKQNRYRRHSPAAAYRI